MVSEKRDIKTFVIITFLDYTITKQEECGDDMIIKLHSPRGIGTIIYVDYKTETVKIENKTDEILDTAFGVTESPTWEDYERFLEERCFPRSRDKMKLVLKDVGVPVYDPLQIIRKTEGRMYDDNLWLEIID